MKTWKEYIHQKFVPADQFIFSTEEGSQSLTIKHSKTGTSFYFFWPTSDWQTLSDIQFHNDKTKGWSGEYNREAKFTKDEIKIADTFLAPAFETGWVSKDIFIGDTHWKSKVYFNLKMHGPPFSYYSADLGCLSVLLFPLYAFYAAVFGQKNIVKVDPVRKYSTQMRNH